MKNRDQTYCLTLERLPSDQLSTSSAVYEKHEITMTVMRCKEMIKHEKKRNELTDFDMILI